MSMPNGVSMKHLRDLFSCHVGRYNLGLLIIMQASTPITFAT